MICEACEYFTGSDCWANPKSVEPCTPERTCPRFKYEASYGKVAELERERCAKICESSAKRYEGLAIAARESRGPLSNSEANEYMWAAECARQQAKQIRGEK